MSESVVMTRRGHSLVIQLNRPGRMNAFTVEMHRSLLAALQSIEDDASIRCIVITGAGAAFCAGQDLGEAALVNGPIGSLGDHLDRFYNPLIRTLRSLQIPVIAAVNGVAAGAGASLALTCDIVVASRSARFIQSFTRIGLVPDSGATWLLPRLVGPQRARAMILLGDPVDAETALQWGLVWALFDDDQLVDAALALAERLAALPRLGLSLAKQALNGAFDATLDRQLDVERDLQTLAGASPDYREALSAFLEKRAPVYARTAS